MARTVDTSPAQAERVLATARDDPIDLDAVTTELEREGLQSFCNSYHRLLDCIESKLTALAPPHETAKCSSVLQRTRD